MDVWRPADTQETAAAWREAILSKDRPIALALSRQTLKEITKTKRQISNISRGGYVVYGDSSDPHAIIIATGSEVSISVSAAEQLKIKGINIRVISMPCQEVYERQTLEYKNKCIPKNFANILAIESGIGESWYKFIGGKGAMISMESFGLSGTGSDVMNHFGFSISNIKKNINKLIKKNR